MEWVSKGTRKRLTFYVVESADVAGLTPYNVTHDDRRYEGFAVWTGDRSRAELFTTREKAEGAILADVARITGAPAYVVHIFDPQEEKLNRRTRAETFWTRDAADSRCSEILAGNAGNPILWSHVRASVEVVTAPTYNRVIH